MSNSLTADDTLVASCLRVPADRTAWDRLYARCAGAVRARIRAGLRAFPDAHVEDVVQDVFVRLAAGGLRHYRGPHLLAYVLTIADHARISENRRWRAQRRDARATLVLDDALAARIEDGADTERTAWRTMERVRLARAVGSLRDPRDRAIITLYFGPDERTDREIADALGMPHDTVTWRRLRAVRELRALYSKTRGGDGVRTREREHDAPGGSR